MSVPVKQRFDLTKDDYSFLYQYLSQFPGETNYPKYDGTQYYDSYVKFFFQDSLHHQLPEGVRVFNKVGWAYGFLTDASYVADFKNKVEFLLSATVYVNSDGILNDNKYEYESVGHPQRRTVIFVSVGTNYLSIRTDSQKKKRTRFECVSNSIRKAAE
ncbi:hypothetical protein [Runella sp.]|uniref:hypothetical protein n=1 Tax=Runella sp. TaxID=1960881 RepID=UPI00262159E6|nr:hypothetical protein [Runella sp.]